MRKELFRIIDANLNRSREGLRVCEDIVRFILNSPTLTKELKSVRHKISNIVKALPSDSKSLFESRDVERDVGRAAASPRSEMRRRSARDIFYANMERVKESLRVLEEFTKLIDEKASAKFRLLRFKIYDIEKRSIKRLSSLRDIR